MGLKALSRGTKSPRGSATRGSGKMQPRAIALGAQGPSQAGTPESSLFSQTPLVSSQIPPQPRRATPTTPPPPVKRRDREALVASGSGEKAGVGDGEHPVLGMAALL